MYLRMHYIYIYQYIIIYLYIVRMKYEKTCSRKVIFRHSGVAGDLDTMDAAQEMPKMHRDGNDEAGERCSGRQLMEAETRDF